MNKSLQTLFSTALAGLLLLGAGCSITPSSPRDDAAAAVPAPAEPPPAPTQPVAPQAAVIVPVAPVTAASPKIEAPKPAIRAPVKAAAGPAQKPQSAAVASTPAPLALDTLEQRLKDTPAIGVFTKLTLKNQVDDLLARFRAHYEGRGNSTIPQLRQSYEQLLAKVHDLLREGDPGLAVAIVNSREAIWSVLTDPAKFAKL